MAAMSTSRGVPCHQISPKITKKKKGRKESKKKKQKTIKPNQIKNTPPANPNYKGVSENRDMVPEVIPLKLHRLTTNLNPCGVSSGTVTSPGPGAAELWEPSYARSTFPVLDISATRPTDQIRPHPDGCTSLTKKWVGSDDQSLFKSI